MMAAVLVEEERKVLKLQEDMTIARLEKEREISAEAADKVLRAERELSDKTEAMQLELKENCKRNVALWNRSSS